MKVILLIGETGTGKSSLGNFILGEDYFIISNAPNSCTNKLCGKKSIIDENIYVIDTPGYNDTSGSDRKNFEDILEYFCKTKQLEFVLLTLNFQSARFPFSCRNLIKFLCQAFPKNFSHHIGIVFTHYDHEYQTKINKNKNIDPREIAKKKYVYEIMKLISDETKENIFLGPPVYFLDSYIKDANSKTELNQLICFAKNISSLDIFQKKDFFIKEEYPETDYRNSTYETADEIVTVVKHYKRKRQILYDGSINYTDWVYDHSQEYRKEKERVIRYEEKSDDLYDYSDDKDDDKDDSFNLGDVIGLAGLAYMAFNFLKK